MKIVDAFWEKRNLNISVTEITIDRTDTLEDIVRTIKEQTSEYQVVRVPDCYMQCNEVLSENGFIFVETMCKLQHNLKKLQADSITERFKSEMTCKRMSEEEIKYLFSELSCGIFKTDRIGIDPRFGIELANKRYIGWITDEIQRGAILFNIYYKETPAGFIIYRAGESGVANVYLGGLYREFQDSGIGAAIYNKGYEFLKQQNIHKAYTSVSTNNILAIRANLKLGYEISSFEYVFVKHYEK